MIKKSFIVYLTFLTLIAARTERKLAVLPSDSSMMHASVSFCIIDSDSGKTVFEYNPEKSLIPASVMKLITTSAAIELLGPDYTFKTSRIHRENIKTFQDSQRRYSNKGRRRSSLGSDYFTEHYADFTDRWIKN